MTKHQLKILISGGSGLIGQALIDHAHPDNIQFYCLTRQNPVPEPTAKVQYIHWDPQLDGIVSESLIQAMESCDLVINLAGESIGNGRLGARHLNRVLNSRIAATKTLVKAYQRAKQKPNTWIQASATGYYGNTTDPVDETNRPQHSLLSKVCQAWELETKSLNIERLITLRIGMVLSPEADAWKRLIIPIKLGISGPLGSGNQVWSWIHIDDLVLATYHLIYSQCAGIFNMVSPNPLPQKQFNRQIAKHFSRPSLIPTPAWILKIVLGNLANELLLNSSNIKPNALLSTDYSFKYPDLNSVLNHLSD